jgi:hypothetical protein
MKLLAEVRSRPLVKPPYVIGSYEIEIKGGHNYPRLEAYSRARGLAYHDYVRKPAIKQYLEDHNLDIVKDFYVEVSIITQGD